MCTCMLQYMYIVYTCTCSSLHVHVQCEKCTLYAVLVAEHLRYVHVCTLLKILSTTHPPDCVCTCTSEDEHTGIVEKLPNDDNSLPQGMGEQDDLPPQGAVTGGGRGDRGEGRNIQREMREWKRGLRKKYMYADVPEHYRGYEALLEEDTVPTAPIPTGTCM